MVASSPRAAALIDESVDDRSTGIAEDVVDRLGGPLEHRGKRRLNEILCEVAIAADEEGEPKQLIPPGVREGVEVEGAPVYPRSFIHRDLDDRKRRHVARSVDQLKWPPSAVDSESRPPAACWADVTHSRLATALVLGASGLQGGAASRALLAAGIEVRGAVRDPDGANGRAVARAGAEPVRVDFGDPSGLRDAMRGVDLVFSVQPSSGQPGSGVTDEQEVAAGLAVVEAAEGEGVRHLVYSSALAARVGRTGVAHFDTKAVIEDRVRRSSLAWTIVRPATFIEMVVEPAAIPRDVVRFLMPADAPLAVVAVDDIGRAVAEIASSPEAWAGAEVDLVGDLVTGTEIARLLADRVGAPVRYEQLDLTAAPPMLRDLERLIVDGPLGGGLDGAVVAPFAGMRDLGSWLDGVIATT